MHHALHQLQQLQVGIQPRRRGAGLQLQDLAESDRRRIDGGGLQLAQRGDHLRGRAVELHYRRCGLNQLRHRRLGIEQLRVIASTDVEVDGQLIEVFEQVDIGVQQAVPAHRREVDVAAEQPGKERIEDVRLRCVDAGEGAANIQLGDGRLRFGRDCRSIERGIEADRRGTEQRLHTASKTAGDRTTGSDFDCA